MALQLMEPELLSVLRSTALNPIVMVALELSMLGPTALTALELVFQTDPAPVCSEQRMSNKK